MNDLLSSLCDLVMHPLAATGPAVSLAILSLVTGVIMLFIFRMVSNQRGIRRAKGRVVSQLLVIRLFRDDPWMTLRGLGGALWENLGYLKHALLPIAVMIVPVGLILIHLDPWYARTPLAAGAEARVAVAVTPGPDGQLPTVRLLPSPDGAYDVMTPPVRIPSLGEIDWRVRVNRAGEHEIRFEIGGRPFTKKVVVGGDFRRVTAVRSGGSLLDALLYPGESRLELALGVTAAVVDYPERTVSYFGFGMAWWLAFFILTLVFAFMLKKPMGVEA